MMKAMHTIILRMINPSIWVNHSKRKAIIKRIKKCGRNFSFGRYSTFVTPELLTVGQDVFIGERAYLSGEIIIGNNVMFGPRALILEGNHIFAVYGKRARFIKPDSRSHRKPTIIEDEVWCGAGVIVLRGTVGMGSVIGAGSVVTQDIPPYVVAVGNYCRPIKRIFTDEVLLKHLRKLGVDEKRACEVVSHRADHLKKMGMELIPVVDQTGQYQIIYEYPYADQ